MEQNICWIREVVPQYVGKPVKAPCAIRGPEGVVRFLNGRIKDRAKEHLIALYLDGAHQVIAYSVVSVGISDKALVHPREVFRPAILAGAVAVIVAHNHPSGEVQVSESDNKMTATLRDAAGIVGLKLLDHVVFTEAGARYSYREDSRILD